MAKQGMLRLLATGRWSLVVGAAIALGCSKELTLRDVVVEAAALEKTLASDHAELRGELARIDAEQGLPLSVGRDLPPDEENAAILLGKAIDPKLRNGILERSTELFPAGRFDYTPLELAEARQFIQKHGVRLQRFHQALARPECVFPVNYRLGFFYEPAFVDDVTIVCRFLAFQIADRLAEGDVTATLEPVKAMWRLAGCMGRERLLPARLRASELRAEALLVVETIANHPQTRRADLLVLLGAIGGQLEKWPPDEECLIGDRAMTLHAYECIRRGLLRWILTSDEKERFRKELNFDSLPGVIEKTIDQDEYFYLAAMREHIGLCRLLYFERKPELARLDQQLDRRRMSGDRSAYPVLAALLFLPGLNEAHQTMARDRARCEAFALALAHAADREPPAYRVNPHHGRPYEVVRETHRIVVKLNEADERDIAIAIPPL